jgi:RNA polymerase sigma-70 factor (ECF subfamily)
VARHLAGDREALPGLVDRHAGRIFNLALRFTGDRDRAEDIAQETFVRAQAALPRSRIDLPFRPWLTRIALNLCRDWARKEKRRPLLFSELEAEAGDFEALVEAMPDESPWPEQQLEALEQGEILQRAVETLPGEDQVLFALRYHQGMSYAEIGRALGIPPATVGTNLFRAKARLRKALEASEVVEGES